MNKNYQKTESFPELILIETGETMETLLRRPARQSLNILFYQPDEPELEGEKGEALKAELALVKRISWERTDYIQNPPKEVRERMLCVHVTGDIHVEDVDSTLFYGLKQTLANRAHSYLEILTKGIPGGVIELQQNQEGIYTPNPNGGASFWFGDKLYQFSIPTYQIKKG